jgi:hypothetical protein
MTKIRITAYKNRFKTKEEQPEYKGIFVVNNDIQLKEGEYYDVALWENENNVIAISITKMSDERVKAYKERKKAKQDEEGRSVEIFPKKETFAEEDLPPLKDEEENNKKDEMGELPF